MLFSLTQYIYFTKENASQKIELAKKAVEGEEDNDSDDADTDFDDFLSSDFNFIYAFLFNSSNKFFNCKNASVCHVIGINTPPPELLFV